jgi:hypothetical protein
MCGSILHPELYYYDDNRWGRLYFPSALFFASLSQQRL